MKLINKLVAMAIALLAMVAVCACSSDEPDPYKGKIDSDFLSALARGEESIMLRLDSIYNLHKKNTDTDWEEVVYVGWGARSLIITNGNALESVRLFDTTRGWSILYHPWEVYCRETGYDKTFEIALPFGYDADKQTVTIGKTVYNIEKADGNELNISHEMESEIDGVPGILKFVTCYIKAPHPIEPESYTVVNSEREGKIAMVKLLREHFGDIFDVSKYYPSEYKDFPRFYDNPVINLAALEDDLVNNRDEWYSWTKATYPDADSDN